MSTAPAIIWFRQDLRTQDNPALNSAYEDSKPVIPVYIYDEEAAGDWAFGGAAKWWLHRSLEKLKENLSGHLILRKGNALDELQDVIEKSGADTVYWNRCYEPWRIKRDMNIKKTLKDMDLNVQSFNGCLLYEPQNVLKDDGTPYLVYTPFFKNACLKKNGDPPKPSPRPERLTYGDDNVKSLEIDDLGLLPDHDWYQKLEQYWTPGEDGAATRLDDFLDGALSRYDKGRDRPDKAGTSRLSPHLHWGEISPREVWHAVRARQQAENLGKDAETFLSELGWREFSYNLLYHFPDFPDKNHKDKFDAFPWEKDDNALKKWNWGNTGYPIVDAGMRQLYEEGWMHNRVRMIVGSFLVKDLRIHWLDGEKWFWDCLVDADLASNSAGWQWVAGCGADAAPYFRIFNPVRQSEKFDPNGDYIRHYVPELKNLDKKHIHAPWDAPDDVLDNAGITLGEDYPEPMVDHSEERDKALKAFQSIKDAA